MTSSVYGTSAIATPSASSAAHAADRVDVALDVVAAERVARSQRRLQVDLGAGLEPCERATAQRLGDGVEGEPAVLHGRDREAGAADRDRVAHAAQGSRLGRHELEREAVGGEHEENASGRSAEGDGFERLAGHHLQVTTLAVLRRCELAAQLLDRFGRGG